MRISNRKTVEGYIKEVKAEFKQGKVLNGIVENSAVDTIEQAKKTQPEFVKAAIEYIKYAERLVKNGYEPTQEGKVENSSEERKNLVKAFSLDTPEKVELFKPEWYITAHELFIYHLLEGVFDASILIEQGALRRFSELLTLYRTFQTVECAEHLILGFYGRSIILIDKRKGQVYIGSSRVARDKIAKYGIKQISKVVEPDGTYYIAKLSNNFSIYLLKGEIKLGSWEKCKRLKDSKKEYIQVVLDSTDDKPAVQFPAHLLVLLAKYGINTIKHLLIKDSLFTCDHLNMVGNKNTLNNLELTTRRDNKLRASSKDEAILDCVFSYNLFNFWKHIEKSFDLDKANVNIKKSSLEFYWNKALKSKSIEEVLAC